MSDTSEQCKLEIQMELNRYMHENGKITDEVYYKVNDILIKRLANVKI